MCVNKLLKKPSRNKIKKARSVKTIDTQHIVYSCTECKNNFKKKRNEFKNKITTGDKILINLQSRYHNNDDNLC